MYIFPRVPSDYISGRLIGLPRGDKGCWEADPPGHPRVGEVWRGGEKGRGKEEGKRLGRDDVTGLGRETAVGRKERVSYEGKNVMGR